DLLSAKDCLELAAIPDRADPSPIAAIRTLVSREFGCSPAEAYLTFQEEPFESRFLYQAHRARLRNGMAVTVRILHPELEAHLLGDVELLILLESAFAKWAGFPIKQAIADFRDALRRQMDFSYEADAMDALACDSKDFDMLAAPTVQRRFCSSKVLTAEFLIGSSLADLISFVTKREPWPSPRSRLSDIDCKDLASRLCRVWLRQALLGNVFPVEPRPEDILVLSEKRIAFTSVGFASFSSEAKTNLWNYLLAAESADPDRACSCLLNEMKEGKPQINHDELEHKFRQVVPFRDGGWKDNSTNDSLAENLFIQWRLASESGGRPSDQLLSFYRGLFLIAAAAEQLAPGHDSLLQGLKEVRLIEMLGQFQQMIGVRPLSNDLQKYATMMMELPRKLDDVLTLASDGNARLKLRIMEGGARSKQKDTLAVSFALSLMLVTVVLLAHYLAMNSGAGAWAERIGATLCVLIGAMLMRVASRAR
ncbi:MAG TPA: AarF/UbiB family protein, partial [Pyrinomonadaceae bacterium]|nr:AarF/UbiB family protein [Pyrinomonadaceae bacterium]